MLTETSANPYHVLDVSPAASREEIVKAMASAMKARKFPPKVIAEAQKCLMSQERRLQADFLLPVLPSVQRFRKADVSLLNEPAPALVFLKGADGLGAALKQAAEIDAQERELYGI